MQFTDEVKWNLADFVVVGAFLIVTGFLLVLASRKVKSANNRTMDMS